MTDEEYEYEIADAAPTDSEGHPVHPDPDKSHRICGAEKSDRTTPTDHGRERDDVPYCTLAAGWGTDSDVGACTNHPYKGSQIGESNPNFKHGKTSEYFKSKLSDRQKEVFDEWVEALDDPEDTENLLGLVGMNLTLRGEHAMDASMIREGRQILESFNIVDNTESVEVEHSGSVETTHDVPDHVSTAIKQAAESNLEGGDEE